MEEWKYSHDFLYYLLTSPVSPTHHHSLRHSLNAQSKTVLATVILQKIEQKLKSSRLSPAKILKQALNSFSLQQKREFFSDCQQSPITELIYQRTEFIDQIIALLWRKFMVESEVTIIAVGGYGRGELFPYSDIDVLILLPEGKTVELDSVKKIMHILWDSGLNLKSNVCQLSDYITTMAEEITVITSLLETRFISGKWELYQNFKKIVKSELLKFPEFAKRKKQEMLDRHHKFNDTLYLLEPNVKESPSSLRDIHTIMWIARANLQIYQFEQFVEIGYLTKNECHNFLSAMHHLWRFRYALHMLTGRDENRLLFDLQIRIAQKFQYKKRKNKHAVELCMQEYYKQLIIIRRICFTLLEELEASSHATQVNLDVQQINRRFQLNGGMIDLLHPYVFKRYPFALLEVFYLMQIYPHCKGLSIKTSKKIIEEIAVVNEDYRQDIRHQSLFMEIIKQKNKVYDVLYSMHEHGLLSAYIKEFAQVEGLMQFDLFHIYTVDAHTLIVIRQLLNFFKDKCSQFAVEHQVAQSIAKPELLVLAGLFHDIGKGGEEEHQFSGARMALKFCQRHGLSIEDCHLVSWLVKSHLEMSITAQKMNIYDPKVLAQFITQNDPHYPTDLDYLYLLTIADISATSPNLLNDYKHTLIRQLWQALKQTMNQTLPQDSPAQQATKIKKSVTQVLQNKGFDLAKIQQFINHWNTLYFVEQNSQDIIKQATLVLNSKEAISLNMHYNEIMQTTELLIWAPRKQYQFALITTCLDHENYSIIQAQVKRDSESYVLYSFAIKKINSNKQEKDAKLLQRLKEKLVDLEKEKNGKKPIYQTKKRLQDRRIKTLPIETEAYFESTQEGEVTILNLVTRDRPGLLALISHLLGDYQVLVVGAYVTTLGGKVEDKFYLLDSNQQPLNTALMQKIIKKIKRLLK